MTATTRSRLAVPRGDRTVRLGGALLAAALLWLPVRHADAAESPPAEAPQPAAAESVPVDGSTVAADSLETAVADSAGVRAGAVAADTLAAVTRAVGLRPSGMARGLRLDGSTGILRDEDLRRWKWTFFHVAEPSRAEPEREDSK